MTSACIKSVTCYSGLSKWKKKLLLGRQGKETRDCHSADAKFFVWSSLATVILPGTWRANTPTVPYSSMF